MTSPLSYLQATWQGHDAVALMLVDAGAILAGADLSSAAKRVAPRDIAKDQLWETLLRQSE